jgi:recyclin-1
LTPAQSSTPQRSITPSNWEDPSVAQTPTSNGLQMTELAAQTAILNSRLERIKTLFSIEVALQLIHMGKETLERIKSFKHLPGAVGEKVQDACENAFVTLLVALGQNHIQPGFEQALEHLSQHKPYDETEGQDAVGPLLTFLELVHIGDLIQQMVDVFFNQEVVCLPFLSRADGRLV